MLSQRITDLFHLLQCTNSDIARYADCSPSNISRLKSGLRSPEPGSRSLVRLAQGIYRYAEEEDILPLLREVCGTEDTEMETLVPGIIRWLYDEQAYQMPSGIQPRSQREQARRLRNFGMRLDRIMTLLEYTNGRLAADLNVDASLVSRYRAGIYHPNRNVQIRARLPALLLARAEKLERLDALAELSGTEPGALSEAGLASWLYASGRNQFSEIAESILRSMDAFVPGQGIQSGAPEIPDVPEVPRYWGTDGLRQAVVRFLQDTAREGGELLLYSDEPMEWMSGDREYFTLWAYLMVRCIQKGVRMRIIHNLERGSAEMASAISGWFPLYSSGMIEPYVFSRSRNPRFCHTVFLRPDSAGILGVFPTDAGENRWYEYIEDPERLTSLIGGFHVMLHGATPFLRTYAAGDPEVFRALTPGRSLKASSILSGLSVGSMPETLPERILSRAGIRDSWKDRAVAYARTAREQMRQALERGELYETLCLPQPEDVRAGRVRVNLEMETGGLSLNYTVQEYAEHLSSVSELLRQQERYHVTLLHFTPFQDLQVYALQDAVAVIRCNTPCAAFVFENSTLVESVAGYCETLRTQFATEKENVLRVLEELRRACGLP